MPDNLTGWISLQRKLANSSLWTSEPFTRGQAWVDLLMLANRVQTEIWIRGIRVDAMRGQLAWSELSLADRWTWSRGKVRRFLQELSQGTEPMIVQQKNRVTSLISIINYDKYNFGGTTDDTTGSTIAEQLTDNSRYTELQGKENSKQRERRTFPTLEQWTEFCKSKHPDWPDQDIENVWNHYESVNWFRGKTKIKKWQLCVSTCYNNWKNSNNGKANHSHQPTLGFSRNQGTHNSGSTGKSRKGIIEI